MPDDRARGEHSAGPALPSALEVVRYAADRRVCSSGEPMQKPVHCRRQVRATSWTALFPSSDAVVDHAFKNQLKA
jgi:hypothetical protein